MIPRFPPIAHNVHVLPLLVLQTTWIRPLEINCTFLRYSVNFPTKPCKCGLSSSFGIATWRVSRSRSRMKLPGAAASVDLHHDCCDVGTQRNWISRIDHSRSHEYEDRQHETRVAFWTKPEMLQSVKQLEETLHQHGAQHTCNKYATIMNSDVKTGTCDRSSVHSYGEGWRTSWNSLYQVVPRLTLVVICNRKSAEVLARGEIENDSTSTITREHNSTKRWIAWDRWSRTSVPLRHADFWVSSHVCDYLGRWVLRRRSTAVTVRARTVSHHSHEVVNQRSNRTDWALGGKWGHEEEKWVRSFLWCRASTYPLLRLNRQQRVSNIPVGLRCTQDDV